MEEYRSVGVGWHGGLLLGAAAPAAVVCCTLLFEEADAQARAGGGYRKLLLATEYRRRKVDRVDPLGLTAAGVRWLDAVVDWGRRCRRRRHAEGAPGE